MKRLNVTQSEFEIYTEENVREKVPESSGIYILWAKQHKGEWNCIHVGHANNLKNNLLTHLSKEEENSRIRAKVQKLVCGYEWTQIAKAE